MENMIITVTDRDKRFFYDIEVPSGVPVEKLAQDIAAALDGHNPALSLTGGKCRLFCNRLNSRLDGEDTLESAGVWNGDFITIEVA